MARVKGKGYAAARARAVRALSLRQAGEPWDVISRAVGFRSPNAARMSVSRLLERREIETVDEYRKVHSARLESLLAAHWDKAIAGDVDAARLVTNVLTSLSRLFGLDAAQRHLVAAGITEHEFGEQAAALLAVTGSDPLRRLAGLPDEPSGPVVVDTVSDGWSNVDDGFVNGQRSIEAADDGAQMPSDELDGPVDTLPRVWAERLPAGPPVESPVPSGPDAAVEVEAEVVEEPLPSGCRRCGPGEVIVEGRNGGYVSVSRYSRRLGAGRGPGWGLQNYRL